MKKCNKCKGEFLATKDFFYRDKNKKDGLTTFCKVCKNVSIKRYEEENKEKQTAYRKQYFADAKNKERKKLNDKQYREKNKEKQVEYFKEYYRSNSERIKANVKVYRQENADSVRIAKEIYRTTFRARTKAKISKHKRRSLIKNLPYDYKVAEWRNCLDYFDNSCAYCGNVEKLEQEHFVSVSNGGGYTKENIVPACLKCNRSKRDNCFYEWYPQRETYTEERKNKILTYLGIL